MFMIPDSIMNQQEDYGLNMEVRKTEEAIEKLERFFEKNNILAYTDYKKIPEWTRYCHLREYLETLRQLKEVK